MEISIPYHGRFRSSSHICREAASLLKDLGEIMIMMMIDDGNDYE